MLSPTLLIFFLGCIFLGIFEDFFYEGEFYLKRQFWNVKLIMKLLSKNLISLLLGTHFVRKYSSDFSGLDPRSLDLFPCNNCSVLTALLAYLLYVFLQYLTLTTWYESRIFIYLLGFWWFSCRGKRVEVQDMVKWQFYGFDATDSGSQS